MLMKLWISDVWHHKIGYLPVKINTCLSCVPQMELLQVAADSRFKTHSVVELLMTDEECDAQKFNKLCTLNDLLSQHSGHVI